nr:hypothetical protein [Candidatus Njordarchaeota archaeon]
MRFKDVFLGAGSMLHGTTVYVYFMIPEKWNIVPSYITPEAPLSRVINDERWVIFGNTSAVIVAEDKKKIKRPIRLQLKVDDRKHFSDVDEWLLQKKREIRKKSGCTLKEAGRIRIREHEGAYSIWVENKKRFGVFGQQYSDANVVCIFRCELTNRELTFKLRSEYPDIILLNKPTIKRILGSIACHERIGKEDEITVGEFPL